MNPPGPVPGRQRAGASLSKETGLETQLCDHRQPFLRELGKRITFVGRRYRVTIKNTHYRVDPFFYHRILRGFALIDLKLAGIQHHDIRPDEPLFRLLRQRFEPFRFHPLRGFA